MFSGFLFTMSGLYSRETCGQHQPADGDDELRSKMEELTDAYADSICQTASEINRFQIYEAAPLTTAKTTLLQAIQFTDRLPHLYVTSSLLYPCHALHLYSTTDAAPFQTVHKKSKLWWWVDININLYARRYSPTFVIKPKTSWALTVSNNSSSV